MPSTSWFFRFSTLAFIVLITPVLGVYLHSPGGFLIVLALSVLVGLFENSVASSLQNIGVGIVNNKWLVFFSLWYTSCVTLNLFVGGNGLKDWRLMMNPIILFIGILYAFSFIDNSFSARFFQISVIVALGLQSAITIPQLYFNHDIARQMWAELSGSWIYGDQRYFSTCAILLPVFYWRSFHEIGSLKLILIACSSLILISASISSFGTPLGLILINTLIIFVLSSLFMRKKRGWILAILLIAVSFSGFRLISSSTLFSTSYTRIKNLISDPRSGGYSGRDLAASRWYLNALSLESFESSPFLGMGGGSTRHSRYVGGHSSLLDTLGAYGILGGGGAFVSVILIVLINAVNRFLHERSWQTMMCLTTVISLTVAGIVNPYWEGLQPLFVILIAGPIQE